MLQGSTAPKPNRRKGCAGNSVLAYFLWTTCSLANLAFVSSADAAKLIFSVNDATSGSNFKQSADLSCTSSGTRELNISGTYTLSNGGKFRITGSTSTSQPRLVCDEPSDKLWLENTKIEWVSGTVSNAKITVWKTFDGATNLAEYSVSASGTFSGTPNGAWLSLRGFVENTSIGNLPNPSNPPPCSAELTRCASSLPATWTFSSSTFRKSQTISPPNPRKLRATFWFKLVAGSNLSVTKLGVKFGPPFGPDDNGAMKGDGRGPVGASQELFFVQCAKEEDISEECKSEKTNCPVCTIKNGSPFDPRSGEAVRDGWIKLKKEVESE